MKFRSIFSGVALVVICAVSLKAQNSTWTGLGGNSEWGTNGNWDVPPSPTSGTRNIFFQNILPLTTDLDQNYNVLGVLVEGTSDFTLTSTGGYTLTGGLYIEQALPSTTKIYATLAGSMVISMNSAGSTATLYSGLNNISQEILVSNGTLIDGAAGAFTTSSTIDIDAPGVVVVNFNETVGGLSDYTTGLGSVLLGSGATLTLQGYSTTFSGVISGSGNLEKGSTGTLTLTGANTYTGNTVVDFGGAIQLGNATTTGSLSNSTTVSGGGTLGFKRSNAYTFAGTISSSGGNLGVVQAGAGTTTLSGTNTYTGTTTVNAGTLQAGSTSAFGGATGESDVTIASGATLALSNFSNTVGELIGAGNVTLGTATLTLGDTVHNTGNISGIISGTGGVVMNGNAQYFDGANTYTGGTTINDGSLVADNTAGSAFGTGSITITALGTLQIGSGDNNGLLNGGEAITDNGKISFFRSTLANTFTNTITGSGGIEMAGFGTETLAGTNHYSGETEMFRGILQAGSTSAFGDTGYSDFVFDGVGSTLDLSSFNNTIGSISGNNGNAVTLGSATLTLGNASALTEFDGIISGIGGSLSVGQSQLTLTGANTYTGGTNVTAGTLIADNAAGSATGTGPITIAPAATLQIGNSDFGGSVTTSVPITANGTLAFARNDNITFAPVVTGTGGITVLGPGSLTLTASNTYAGQTNVSAGTLITDNASGSATGTSAVIVNEGGILQIGNDDGNGGIASPTVLDEGAITFHRTDLTSFAPAISGSGGVSMVDDGTVDLSGDNPYSGATLIENGGTLVPTLTTSMGSGASDLTINSSGILDMNGVSLTFGSLSGDTTGMIQTGGAMLTIGTNSLDTTFGGNISGTGGLTVSGSYTTLVLNGPNTYSGMTTIEATDTLQLGDGGSAGDIQNSSVVNGAGTLAINRSSPLAISSSLQGLLSVEQDGTGTTTLSGNNSYSGSTVINAGTIQINSANAFAGGGTVDMTGNGIFDVNSYNVSIGGIQDSSPTAQITLGAGTLNIVNSISNEFDGVISGSGMVKVIGSSFVTLDGNNTYLGGTEIGNGAGIYVGSNTALGTGSVTIDAGSQFSPSGNVTLPNNFALTGNLDNETGGTNNLALNGHITGSGEIEWNAPGTLTLSGTNNFTGGVDMSQGSLVLGNNAGAGNGGIITLGGSTSLTVLSGVTVSNAIATLGSANVLAGNGTIATPVTADASIVLSPSNGSTGGPGTLTFSNGLTLATGGAIHFDIYDAAGSAGTGYSQIVATGGLNLATTTNSVTFNVVSTDASGNAADAMNFNAGNPYSWAFATSSTAITGAFNAGDFQINTSGFSNSIGAGVFGITEVGDSLYLNFTPVPEPSTWCLMGLGLVGAAVVVLRRRKLAGA